VRRLFYFPEASYFRCLKGLLNIQRNNNMDHTLLPGIQGRQEITVAQKDTASAYGSGLVEVFATPAMIALMENTAHQSVQPHLPDGHLTVGFEVNIRHLKATPVGAMVWAESELLKVEGKKLTFSVRAFDEGGEIGSGTHTRYIVHQQKFMSRL
jgi:fluoroacetyl-CoA thioesterase